MCIWGSDFGLLQSCGRRRSVLSKMSQKKNCSDAAIELARKYDVSDLIFRFNCANYFCTEKSDHDTLEDVNGEGDSGRQSIDSKQTKSAETVRAVVKTNQARRKERARKHLSVCRDTKTKPDTNFHGELLTFPQPLPSHTSVMTLAVDATPNRVGGLLRLPGKERTIFYYTIDWTDRFLIDDSTRFEMINAALALELFEPYLKAYRRRYDKFVVKTDNHFFESMKGLKNADDFEFLMKLQKRVKSYEGEFQHAVVSTKDPDIQNADYLSRTELPLGLKFGYSIHQENSNDEDYGAADYALVDLSSVASGHSLNSVSKDVPQKYLKS